MNLDKFGKRVSVMTRKEIMQIVGGKEDPSAHGHNPAWDNLGGERPDPVKARAYADAVSGCVASPLPWL